MECVSDGYGLPRKRDRRFLTNMPHGYSLGSCQFVEEDSIVKL